MGLQTEHLLITGSSGFIGRQLVKKLEIEGASFSIFTRNVTNTRGKKVVSLEDLAVGSQGVDVVIHLAGRAHVLADKDTDSQTAYQISNVEQTIAVATSAYKAGAKRFIFISSIGVNGLSNFHPFDTDSPTAPSEEYAKSKLEAELALKQMSEATGMEVVIIRPPLVYGPAAPGNFGRLAKLAQKNLPLPLGAIHNKRSLVALDNLVDLIVTCIDHPKAANQTFLVSDDSDVSTTELLQLMTRAAGKMPRLIPVPVSWLKLAGKLLGKQAVVDRLCGNLQVDISHTKETLGWKPPITVEEGIARCFAVKG